MAKKRTSTAAAQPKKEKRELVLERQTGYAAYVLVFVAAALYYSGVTEGTPYDVSKLLIVSTAPYRQPEDAWFVLFWVVAFVALRMAMQGLVLLPLATLMGTPKKFHHKFFENGWTVMFFIAAWAAGMYVTFLGPDAFIRMDTWYWEDTSGLWRDYPHQLTRDIKLYYLLQIAFWLSFLFIQFISAKRGDFILMLLHHVVTITLLLSSYYCGFFRTGALVLTHQDTADILLPLAKLFKYSNMPRVADIIFALFSVVWIYTRHYLYFFPLRSLWQEADTFVSEPYSPETHNYYDPFWTKAFFTTFLGSLQVLLLIWLKHLLVAVYKALFVNKGIEDHLSDSEDEDDTNSKNKKHD